MQGTAQRKQSKIEDGLQAASAIGAQSLTASTPWHDEGSSKPALQPPIQTTVSCNVMARCLRLIKTGSPCGSRWCGLRSAHVRQMTEPSRQPRSGEHPIEHCRNLQSLGTAEHGQDLRPPHPAPGGRWSTVGVPYAEVRRTNGRWRAADCMIRVDIGIERDA